MTQGHSIPVTTSTPAPLPARVVVVDRAAPPPDGAWTFDALLGPVTVEAFCRDHWGRTPLLVHGGAAGFASLTSMADIETLLAIPRVLEDRVVSIRHKDQRVSLAPRSVGDIYQQLRQGASLQLRKMEQLLPPTAPLARLYRDMVLRLQHPGVSISAFISPPGTELLGAHHDDTEIFTLQIAGSKRWRLYGHTDPTGRRSYPADGLDAPEQEFLLRAGDMLYLPRGYVHEVISEDDLSLSLPIIIGPVTWKDLLPHLIDRLESQPAFLEALPAGLLLRPDAATRLAEGLAARVALIAAEAAALDISDLLDRASDHLLAGVGAPADNRLAPTVGLPGVDAGTLLVPRHGGAYRVSLRDGRATLTLGGGDVMRGPAAIAPALEAIMARREPVAAGALHEALSDQACLVLARRLVDIGALTVAPDAGR